MTFLNFRERCNKLIDWFLTKLLSQSEFNYPIENTF